jgi:hypothetical protein
MAGLAPRNRARPEVRTRVMDRAQSRLGRVGRVIAPYAVPAAVFLVIVLVMFWRAWTPIEGERRAFAWDAKFEYWGDLELQADGLATGELPLWNPHDRLGYPFYADPQVGLLYPVQWPLVVAGAITDTPWWLVTVKVLLHFEICALGMFALLRRRKLPPACCYLGGIIAITSYPMLHNSFSALNWSFAWVPWWLYAVERWIDGPSWGRSLAMAVTAALTALAGGWAAFWYGGLVVGPFAIAGVIVAARAKSGDERRVYLRRLAITGGAAAGWFLVLAGAQVLATSGLVGDTVRDERDVKFFGTTVFSAVDIFGFFVPRAQGENVYLGWGPILWVAFAVALRPTVRSLVLAGVFGLAILCAMGDGGPLPSFASIMPAFGLFRRAHRYLYVGVIPIAILAAEGLALLPTLDADARARLRKAVVVATWLVVAVCGVGFAVKVAHPWKPDAVRDAFGWGIGAGLVGGFLTWLVLAHPTLRGVLVIVVAVAGIDLWVARTQKIEAAFQAVPVPAFDAKALAIVGGDAVPRRIYDNKKIQFRPGIRLGLRDLGGYEGDPLALQRFQRVLDAVKRSPKSAATVGIATIFDAERPIAVQPPDGKQLEPGVTALVNAAPDVQWFDAASVAPDGAAALSRALAAPPGTIAVVEAPQIGGLRARLERVDAAGAAPVTGRLTALALTSLRAEIDAPADGLVRINELYYRKGWTARVDGAEVPIVAVDGWARGVLVGPGHHVIEMEFSATGYLVGAAISVLGWLASLAFVVAAWRRRGRGRAAEA